MVDIIFEIANVRVRILQAPDIALWMLHHNLAYMSPGMAPEDGGAHAPADTEYEEKYTWDGMVRFLRRPSVKKDGTRSPPWFETGLLPRAMKLLSEKGYSVQLLDLRVKPEMEDVPLFWPQQPLRDYQETAVNEAVRSGRGVIVAPPRAGKTRIFLELIRRLNVPTLLMAPTTSIVDQTVRVALEYGFPKDSVVHFGEEGKVDLDKASRALLWVCTVARACSFSKEAAASRQALVCDELHHYTKGGSWGQDLQKLFAHVYHWYGATGTYFRSNGDDMSLEAFLSDVVYRIESPILLERKLLVPTRFAFVPVDTTPMRSGGDARREGIQRHDHRNGLAAAAAIHMAATGRRVLVMVGVKEQGRRIEEMCNHHGPQGKRGQWKFAEFLYRGRGAKVPSQDMKFRLQLQRAFLEGTGPSVLIGTSLIGEGVDLPDADALVWARGESAAVSYLQGCFRVCTASPGKDSALIIDFADRHHPGLMQASLERLQIATGEPVFSVSVLSSATDLAVWAGKKAA